MPQPLSTPPPPPAPSLPDVPLWRDYLYRVHLLRAFGWANGHYATLVLRSAEGNGEVFHNLAAVQMRAAFVAANVAAAVADGVLPAKYLGSLRSPPHDDDADD